MTREAIEDLDDRFKWLIAQLRLRELPSDGASSLEALRDLAISQQKLSSRVSEDVPMKVLIGTAQLSETESLVVTLLAGYQLSPWIRTRIESMKTARTDDGGVPLELVRSMVYGANLSVLAYEELACDGRLARLGVIERNELGACSLSRRVLSFLVGTSYRKPAFVRAALGKAPPMASLAVDTPVLSSVRSALGGQRKVVVVSGPAGSGRRTVLEAACNDANIEVLVVDARRMATTIQEFNAQLRAVALECLMRTRAPLIVNSDCLEGEGRGVETLVETLSELIEGRILITCGVRPPASLRSRSSIVIEMGQPTTAQRASLWHSSLGQGTEADAQLLAERYPLAPALIVRASEAAKARANGRALEPEDIYAGIRSVLDDRLGAFAKRVEVTQTWDDLVLPPDQLDTIVELMARVRGRTKVYEQWGFAKKVGKGLGVSALFSGPPGTGKTMVAALIARDLGLELYQVDMGKVVSKFIGETEKNVGALFDAAEAGHAILLFDEADALFGKRTDVKSSNDRYANLETNYLLQRLESFTGICLLTTNHDSHIDPAFQRRLSLHLRFELPDVEERAQLWRATLPVAAPLAGDIDFEALARRYAMSGGYIRNATLRAAFLAADENSDITAAHLERAARVEYEGMGKIAA